jgi:thermostable 8-oxoguanine DNA glycosylase
VKEGQKYKEEEEVSATPQQEGYWQQSLHQLGKTKNFPKSELCLFIYYLTSGLIIIF